MMKFLKILFFLFFSINAYAQEVPIEVGIPTILAYGHEIANNFDNRGSYYVRLYKVPVTNGECWGAISSCPDVQILISVSEGDLYEEPAVFALPLNKGWDFVKWVSNNSGGAVFQIKTVLPQANIEEAERKAWKSTTYQVLVTMGTIKYEAVNEE